ncbi:MAG TPA: hypothetical protein VHW23_45520 [Kofleriaceae bacterium]|nr:hypothetical protein [Kofleriaceae bacterium]
MIDSLATSTSGRAPVARSPAVIVIVVPAITQYAFVFVVGLHADEVTVSIIPDWVGDGCMGAAARHT